MTDTTPARALPLSTSERDELRRGKGTRLPLILVLLALGLAIVIPRLTHRRIAELRNDINNVADPARLRVTEIQLEMALEGSQRRGYLLTGDEALAKQFELSRQRRIAAERDLLGYSVAIDKWGRPGLSGDVQRLIGLDHNVDSLVAIHGAVSTAALDQQRASFVAAQRLSDTVASNIERAAESRRATISETESMVALSTALLLLLGIGAAVLVARLGSRFRTLALRLDEQEARFRQITENLSAVVLLSDPEFKQHLYVNGAYERIWGRSRESLEADPESFMEGIHPDDRARVRDSIGEVEKRVADLEFRLVRPDGEVRWVWGRAFPVRNADGRVFRIAGIVEDVTARHEYAEERERLLEGERTARETAEKRRAELERVSESRARLVRGFTHDVRTRSARPTAISRYWKKASSAT